MTAWVELLGLGLLVGLGLSLAWRRIRPVVVAAAVVVASGGYGLVVFPAPPYAGWVALFAVAAHVPGFRRAMGGVVAAALVGGVVQPPW